MPRKLCLALALAGAFALAEGAGPAVATAEAQSCRSNLFLTTGISDVSARNIPCRRAVRVLRNWARGGMPPRGPRGWSCRMRRHGGVAPYTRARCSRNAARIRFMIGG